MTTNPTYDAAIPQNFTAPLPAQRLAHLERLEAIARRLNAAYARADKHGIERALAALNREMPMEDTR